MADFMMPETQQLIIIYDSLNAWESNYRDGPTGYKNYIINCQGYSSVKSAGVSLQVSNEPIRY